MTTNNISNYLVYAQLQMAAEALIDLFGNKLTVDSLTFGNTRSSKFTTTQAEQFITEWDVLEHKGNTTTGFSGTLFTCKINDSSRDLYVGKKVISFRSTEFADDAVRDNQATNTLEIKEFGWAFGQIDDMENWYKSLIKKYDLGPDNRVDVTGYSLGGHLATAFNLLHPQDAQDTYTFNGAGVGSVKSGSLSSIIEKFDLQRKNLDGQQITFADKAINDAYQSVRESLKGGKPPSFTDEYLTIQMAVGSPADKMLILEAFTRIRKIINEQERITTVVNGDGPPRSVDLAYIEATSLDYQIAVLIAARSTSAEYASVPAGGWAAYAGRHIATGGPIPGFYDLYGANLPAAVANSQLHWGTETPITIEDQPLYRGSVVSDALITSVGNAETKLLVDNFSKNDFGDTHSLVLIIDSLTVQDFFAKLDQGFTTAQFASIFAGSSNLKSYEFPGVQGDAEGDVLENIVNSLADTFGLAWNEGQRLKGNPAGGTWAIMNGAKDSQYTDRATFYRKLKEIQDSNYFKGLSDGVAVVAPPKDGLLAKNDFGAFLSLYYQTPFALKPKNDEATALLKAANGDLGLKWAEDKALSNSDHAAGKANFSDQYLRDRAKALEWIIERNKSNISKEKPVGYNGENDRWRLEDRQSQIKINTHPNDNTDVGVVISAFRPLHNLTFGSELNDGDLNGTDNEDHLYGGKGNDTLDGGKGNDYLEGNEDNDQITGGDGDDILRGGKGDDTYLFDGSFGRDVIYDSDEGGSIQINGNVLTGGKKVSKGIWKGTINDVTYIYTELDDEAGGKDLYIKKEGSDGSDSITIRKWENKHLGINLEGPKPVETEPGFDLVWRGDRWDVKNDRNYMPNVTVHAIGGQGDDLIDSSLREEMHLGEGGNDWLEGNEGNDMLKSGWGDDTLDGGSGNDQLAAGEVDAAFGVEIQHPQGSDNNVVNGGSGNDQISAGRGNDLLNGDEGDDIIVDGSGKDTINGGDGDDWIIATGGWTTLRDFGLKYAGRSDFWKFSWSNGESNITVTDSTGIRILGSTNYPISVTLGLKLDTNPGWETKMEYADDGIEKWEEEHPGEAIPYGWVTGGTTKILASENYETVAHVVQSTWNLTGKLDGVFHPIKHEFLFNDPSIIDAGSTIDGGAGRDHIFASHGSDFVHGGSGDDMIWGRGGADILSGDEGDDEIYGDSSPAHYVPLLNGDVIDTWEVKAALHAGDLIDGGKGDDILFGQGGADTVIGGEGDDDIYGDDIYDKHTALSIHGNDLLDGGDGNDTLTGGGRDDSLSGGNGDDILWGDGYVSDKKILEAGLHGSDYLDGGEGNDTLAGGGLADTLLGGAGNDNLFGDDAKTDLAKLGSNYGDDYLDGQAGDDVLDGGGGNDTVIGGEGDDTLYGDNGSESVEAGNQGNDLLVGGDGNDYLKGENGKDTLDGGVGIDILEGGEGDDTYHFNVGDSRIQQNQTDGIQDSEGSNTIEFGAGISQASLKVSKAESGDMILGYSDSDFIIIKGGFAGAISTYRFADGHTISHKQLMDATQGVDIESNTKDDTVAGGMGDDRITVNGGAANVTGGAGNDKLKGRNGNNTYVFRLGDGHDDINDAGLSANGGTVIGGNRIVMGTGIAAKDVSLTTVGGSLQLKLASGDSIKLSATDIQDLQSSRALDKVVFADNSSLSYTELLAKGVDVRQATLVNGVSVLQGTSVDDRIYGSSGNDSMLGAAGNDSLYGGESDTMDGGAGDDSYYISKQGSAPVNVLIKDASGNSELKLGAGFSSSDFSQVAAANSRDLVFMSGSNTITVQNGKDNLDKINSISFGDGSVLNKEAIAMLGAAVVVVADGTPGNDQIKAADGGGRIHGYAGDDSITGGQGDDLFFGDDGNDTLAGGAGNDKLFGGEDDDVLQGGGGSNVLDGGYGSDSLVDGAGNGILLGGYGDDTYQGGAGDDRMLDDYGDDTYVFNIGDGKDTIFDGGYKDSSSSSLDILRFGAGITADQLRVSVSEDGTDLIIGYGDADQVTILAGANGAIGFYEFADGSKLGHDDILTLRAGEQKLSGTGDGDRLTGAKGNDVIETLGGNDTLSGGAGNDTLLGGTGDDLYLFKKGDGVDTIIDADGKNIIRFAPGIQISELRAHALNKSDGTYLQVQIGNAGDQILLKDGLSLANTSYQFADGSLLRHGQLMDMVFADGLALNGSASSDKMYGGMGSDVIDGGAGNDLLAGGHGMDTYLFGRGDGQDVVVEVEGESNLISLKVGVALSDLTVQRQGDNLYVGINGSDDGLTVNNYFASDTQWNIRTATGSLATVASVMAASSPATPGSSSAQKIEQYRTNFLTAHQKYLAVGNSAGVTKVSNYADGGVWVNESNKVITLTPAISKTISDEAEITALNPVRDMATTVQGDITTSTTVKMSYGGYVSKAPVLVRKIELEELRKTSTGFNNPPGSMPVYVDKIDPVTGEVKKEIGHFNQYQNLPSTYVANAGSVTTTVYERHIQKTTTITMSMEDIRAGASNNHILYSYAAGAWDATGYQIIDAGDGDDFVDSGMSKFDPSRERVKWTLFNPKMKDFDASPKDVESVYYQNDDGASGCLVYGGAGDDTLLGTGGRDDIIGGDGNDFMNGGAQGDWYRLSAGDAGWDVIYDSGVADRTSMQFPAEGAFDVDIDQSNLPKDTVIFEAGINLNDLQFSWGRFEGDTPHQTLNISWGQGKGVRIVLANGDEGKNFGIENFEFADGSKLSLDEMMRRAPARPSLGSNIAPTVTGTIAEQKITEKKAFSFTLPDQLFSDANVGDVLSYSLSLANGDALPAWLTFDAATRKLTGTPGHENVGDLSVRVTAKDEGQLAASLDFSLKVIAEADVNTAPEVKASLADQALTEMKAFTLAIPDTLFADADKGDVLAYSVTLADGKALPAWLTFDAITKTLSGTPDHAAVGDLSLSITVKDKGGLTAKTGLNLHVAEYVVPNTAPVVVKTLSDQAATENAVFSYVIPAATFKDADAGDVLTYSVTLADGKPLPAWLTFNPVSMKLSGTPDHYAVGDLSLSITVKDKGGLTAKTSLNLHVAEYVAPNTAPVAAKVLTDQSLTEKAAFSFALPAGAFTDVDAGDVLSYSATLADGKPLPAWLTFDAQTKTLSGTPDHAAFGDLSISIQAKDKGGLTATSKLVLHIAGATPGGLTGTDAADVLTGTTTADVMSGGAGADTLSGGAGNDSLTGGTGDDVLNGDAGDDQYYYAQGDGLDFISDTAGVDSLNFASGLNLDNLIGTVATVGNKKIAQIRAITAAGDASQGVDFEVTVDAQGKVISPIEKFMLSDGKQVSWDDLLVKQVTVNGGNAAEVVRGGRNDDTIFGVDGNDTIYGGYGNDKLDGGNGEDVAYGGVGNDRIYGQSGNDALYGDDGDDLLDGSSGNDTLDGGEGKDTLDGGDGIDILYGRAGDDKLTGGNGNDMLDGGDGNDILDGGDYDDTLYGGNGDDIISAGYGNDYVSGGNGTDTITLANGNDVAQGGAGNDVITGDYGNKLVDAGDGDDTITMNVGNHWYAGGKGNDTIDPGQGLNVFAFNRGDGADIYKNNKVNGNTISLGKGIKYADLSLSKSGMDLVLKLGQGDSITLKDWYANQGLRGVDRLQFITEGGDYDAASTDKTKNSKVEVFDFTKLVQKFDASLAATPGLNQWAVMTSMLDAHLYGSNTAAIGGDLSYQYGLNGNLTGIGLSVIQTSLAANDFNNNKGQALHTRPQLETGALLLM